LPVTAARAEWYVVRADVWKASGMTPRGGCLCIGCPNPASAAGVHIKAVADLLGHSSIAITGDIYGHACDAATRSAVDGLSEALGL
jgi:integrase